METYLEMTNLSKRFFQIIGISVFDMKWHPVRLFIFIGYQILSIISNGLVSARSLQSFDLNVFSTCIVILSATALVVVKILILLCLSKDFNNSFGWMKRCFIEEYEDNEINKIWRCCYRQCKTDTLFYTRYIQHCFFSFIYNCFTANKL